MPVKSRDIIMSYRLYPHDHTSRRDAIAAHRGHIPHNDQSFVDGVLQRDGVAGFQNVGAVQNVGGVRTIYEGTMAASKAVFSLHLTGFYEKWAADLGTNVQHSTDFIAGISSSGITTAFGSLARQTDQDLTLTFSPAATFTRSVIAGGPVTLLVPADGFQLRSLDDVAVSLFTIAPASITAAGSNSIHEADLGSLGAVFDFTLQNSEEAWNSIFNGASTAVGAALAAGVAGTSLTLTSSNFIRQADPHVLRLSIAATSVAAAAYTITFPTSAFNLLGHNYAFGTFLTVLA